MKGTASLRRKILARKAIVGIIGQGYVGLTLACEAAAAGFEVIGLDIDPRRVEDLRAGALVVPGVGKDIFSTGIATNALTFTTEVSSLSDCDIVIICVPTPVRDHAPDLSYVEGAAAQVAGQLKAGNMVILESTTYPGTTEQLVRPLLETSGLKAGREFLLAYSPERIDPGNPEYGMRNTPKVVGGISKEATGAAALFYGQFVDKVFVVSSSRAAELAKLLENTFRHINVALVNEMAMLCHEMDIDVWEVIDATATKPFGFMPFYPGPGVGGHCIPLDPAYLAWQVRRDAGHQFRILEEAQDINAQMPAYVAGRISDALNNDGKAVKGARIFILGVSYKPDVGDVRESPAVKVAQLLFKRGAKVQFHDPYVDAVTVNGSALVRTEVTQRAISGADCVAILTPHSAYDLSWVADQGKLIFDARNAYGDDRRRNVTRL